MLQRQPLNLGIILVLGTNILIVITLAILNKLYPYLGLNNIHSSFFWSIGLPFLWLIGVGQFLYVIPLIIFLAIQRRYEFIKGVAIGVVITFFLNAAGCYLLSVIF